MQVECEKCKVCRVKVKMEHNLGHNDILLDLGISSIFLY